MDVNVKRKSGDNVDSIEYSYTRKTIKTNVPNTEEEKTKQKSTEYEKLKFETDLMKKEILLSYCRT